MVWAKILIYTCNVLQQLQTYTIYKNIYEYYKNYNDSSEIR